MSGIELPKTGNELDLELLNKVLLLEDKWSEPLFVSLDVSVPPGAKDGMSHGIYRIDGVLQNGEAKTLVAKIKGGQPATAKQAGSDHEVTFYREIAPIAGVESPKSYAALFDESNGRSLLILESLLGRGDIGSINTYLSVEKVERVVTALAGMHAKWWNSDDLISLNSVRTFEQVMEGGKKQFDSGRFSGRRFLEQFGDLAHPAIVPLYESWSSYGSVISKGFSSNRTLCNYDVAAKNLLLPHDPDQPPVFFDWSLLTRGSIGIELAVTLAYSLSPEDHAQSSRILAVYLETMRSHGVSDLEFSTLWNDFQRGLLIRLAAPIALTSRNDPAATELAMELLPRITSAVLATDAIELIRKSA